MADDEGDNFGGSGRGFWLGSEAGALIELPGWKMRVKIAETDTRGCMTLIQGRMTSGHGGPPAHVHTRHDEAFFILSGELKFRVGDTYRVAVSGETVFASRGLAHGFSNPGPDDAQYLVALTPSGYEQYFEKLAAMIRAHGSMPSESAIVELMAEHGAVLANAIAETT